MAGSNNNNALVWGGVFLGGGYLLYKYVLRPDVIQPLQTKQYVTRLRVNLPAVRFKGDTVEFDLYVQNPNSTPLKIDAIVGDVYVTTNGKQMKIGNVDKYQAVTLQPTAETKFTFSIKLKILNVLAYFQNIFSGKVAHQVFSFIGNININGKVFPVKESYKIS